MGRLKIRTDSAHANPSVCCPKRIFRMGIAVSTELQIPLERRRPSKMPTVEIGVLTKALPYFWKPSSKKRIVHRVRRGTVYWLRCRANDQPHTAINFWCANTGFISKKSDGTLIAAVPSD